MTELAPDAGLRRKNPKLKSALLQHKALSLAGLSERLFGLLFSGLVYPQIWEDPIVDMAAMQVRPGHRIVTIGSGGCNMLTYLSAAPARIDVVDLNPHHIALNRLKLAAFRHLPSHKDVVRFLAVDGTRSNSQAYDLFIAPKLDAVTRAYWSGRDLTGRRRVSVFERNIYRTGLLGRFIAASHVLARLHGINPEDFVRARSMREQRQFFDDKLAPLFDRRVIRWITGRKSSLFGLGIPPQQFDELASLSSEKSLAAVLRQRLEKLTCHFPLRENYFAWQAFARRYPLPHEGELPAYLQNSRYEAIRNHVERVAVHHASFTELLAGKPASSVDRYVLLDAQDWMTDRQLNDLWTEITRTADDGAVVIFRTAAEASILPGRVSDALLDQWHYDAEASAKLGAEDRSAIYGGFHIYRKKA
jgi:S-adenosylmethionine-diacylglycerol 3-amino-3-carboxypropyl transferase